MGKVMSLLGCGEHDNIPILEIEHFIAAAKDGSYRRCAILYENGCPWGTDVVHAAAEHGNMVCLKFLMGKGCPWNVKACEAAARCGHTHIIKIFHRDYKLKLSKMVLENAILSGNDECVAYVRSVYNFIC